MHRLIPLKLETVLLQQIGFGEKSVNLKVNPMDHEECKVKGRWSSQLGRGRALAGWVLVIP